MKRSLVSVLVPILALGIYFGGRYIYFKPKFDDGDPSLNFSATLIGGSPFELKSLDGHYILLDFWASWCGPCRKENPAIVALYREFENLNFRDANGFEIVSIAVEKREDSWKRAIEKDGLYWSNHILDLAGSTKFIDSPIAKLYQVREVPTKFLLNPKREIIAVNPSVEEIRKTLNSRLGK